MRDASIWRAAIQARVTPLGLSPEREVEIVEEVAQHLEDRYREARAAGLDDASAESAAWRELEDDDVLGRELAKGERRQPLELPPPGAPARGRWLRALWQDTRYALRTLRQQPTFTATVLLALALAIGPTTAIVSVGNWLFWRPVAGVSNADRIDLIWFGTWTDRNGSIGVSPSGVSSLNLAELESHLTSSAGLAGLQESSGSVLAGSQAPRMLGVSQVTADFFDVLGVWMAAGRAFTGDEDRPPLGSPVAVISQGFATSAFGSPDQALGQRILLNQQPFRVIGVAGRGFRGIGTTSRIDVWMTGATFPYFWGYAADSDTAKRFATREYGPFYQFVSRRKPGVTTAAFGAELAGLSRNLADAHPADNAKFKEAAPRVFAGLNMPPLQRPRMQSMVNILLGIGAVLLLLGCANAANMLIARAIRREHECAIRKALGAGRARLVQLQLTEACLLAAGAAVLGLGVALVLKQVMQQWLFPLPPGMIEPVPIDVRVLGVTAGAAMLVGTVAGVAPAWLIARGRFGGTIVRSGSLRTASRAPRLRSALAVVQLSLSLALIIGALLLVTTVRNLRAVDLGFDPASVTTLRVDLSGGQAYTLERAIGYQRDLLTSLRPAAGLEATIGLLAPFSSSSMLRVLPPGAADGQTLRVASNGVAHNYFSVLRTPIVRGRAFTEDEAFAPAPVETMPVIIDETLARRLFGDTDPIGRTVHLPKSGNTPGRDLPVVGVARDVRWVDVVRPPEPFLYQPLGRYDFRTRRAGTIMIRSTRPQTAVASDVRAAAARLDRAVPLSEADSLSASIDRDIREQRLFAGVLSWLGVLAFVLAAIGLHGLVAQTTAERTREFGIRLAIGAARADIARLVARYVVTILALGTTGGLGLAALGAPLVKSMLFGVSTLDAATYLSAVGILAAVIAIAAAWPALRATRVQPVEVLRVE